jgi:ubiquinone/menaquinone biosynthesis C-methylase UbiE
MVKSENKIERSDAQVVCPWWLCFTFGDNFLRRWLQNPARVVQAYLKPGDTVLDVGPGMGYFTIPMAKLVGPDGRIIAVDLQKPMLNAIARRAAKAGLEGRIQLQQCQPDDIGVKGPLDFALAFWMLHEVPDQSRLLRQIAAALKPGAKFLLVEPQWHVNRAAFDKSLDLAFKAGFQEIERPRIFISNAVLLQKKA